MVNLQLNFQVIIEFFILIINYIKKKNKSIRVPLIYSLPFGYYVKKKDTLSRLLKNHVYISKNFNIETKEKDVKYIFMKRNKLLNENIKFLIENKISLGLYKFGWFLKK